MIIRRIKSWLKNKIKRKSVYQHISAYVDNMSIIGKNVNIGPWSIVIDCNFGQRIYLSHSVRVANTTIKGFCSIGPEVRIGGLGTHPTNFISTHPAFYSTQITNGPPLITNNSNFKEHKHTLIGFDVWIGARALILDGVNVGSGSIIAAGAVVNKDVPPYSIVAGVPAKIIRYRFSSEMIEKLLALQWWNIDELKQKEIAAICINNGKGLTEEILDKICEKIKKNE